MNKAYLWISLGIIVISINIAKSFTGIKSDRAIYVYDLIKNTNWPTNNTSKEKFVIGVLGNSEALSELKDLSAKRRIAARDIIVNELTSVTDVENCNLVYISPTNSFQVKTVTELVKNKGILVVTEGPGMLEKGAPVNLVTDHGKLKYEVNTMAAHQARLSFNHNFLAKSNAVN